jgi:hypothetical protein
MPGLPYSLQQEVILVDRLSLSPRHWYAWQVLGGPRHGAPFDATPAFVAAIVPLKTGRGILRVDLVRAVHPIQAVHDIIDLTIERHAPDAIIGSWSSPEGRQLVALTEIDFDWLKQHCAGFWTRFDPQLLLGEIPSVQDYLNMVLGAEPDAIVAGAHSTGFGCELRLFSGKVGTMPVERTYDGLDAWLILRGAVPRSMDDRWFIYAELYECGGTLFFRRSWTGLLVWTIAFLFTDEGIAMTEARVCLDRSEYGFGTRAEEAARLDECIASILLGRTDIQSSLSTASVARAEADWAAEV